MCLYNAKAVINHDDLICYKVLGGGFHEGTLQNIDTLNYPQVHYEIGKTKSIDYKRLKTGVLKYDLKNKETPYISNSAYHSFTNIDDAIDFAKKNIWLKKYIVKCIIPKNSAYVFEGEITYYNYWEILHGDTHEYVYSGYASQKIKPIEIIAIVNIKHGDSEIEYYEK